mmetsp:Transcript_1438/g.4359  ORF Transcript_1438/g.4359 Transcript_1438/m.4359 type:complete len:428 (-) Transcript_1438:623-1906(-)
MTACFASSAQAASPAQGSPGGPKARCLGGGARAEADCDRNKPGLGSGDSRAPPAGPATSLMASISSVPISAVSLLRMEDLREKACSNGDRRHGVVAPRVAWRPKACFFRPETREAPSSSWRPRSRKASSKAARCRSSSAASEPSANCITLAPSARFNSSISRLWRASSADKTPWPTRSSFTWSVSNARSESSPSSRRKSARSRPTEERWASRLSRREELSRRRSASCLSMASRTSSIEDSKARLILSVSMDMAVRVRVPARATDCSSSWDRTRRSTASASKREKASATRCSTFEVAAGQSLSSLARAFCNSSTRTFTWSANSWLRPRQASKSVRRGCAMLASSASTWPCMALARAAWSEMAWSTASAKSRMPSWNLASSCCKTSFPEAAAIWASSCSTAAVRSSVSCSIARRASSLKPSVASSKRAT